MVDGLRFIRRMKVDLIGKYRAQWGEGPIWWEGRLVYVDIEEHRVISVNPDSGEEEVFNVGERV